MPLERFGGFFGGSHPLRQLFIHQCEADIVLAAVEEVIEPLQLTEKMERSHEEMQLHVGVSILHALDGIESGANARGERLLRQPSAAARTIEVFAELRERPLHWNRERFTRFTDSRRAFNGFSRLHEGHYSSFEIMP
jgi:hypothetical protein